MSALIDGIELSEQQLKEIKRFLIGKVTSKDLIARAYGLTPEQLQKVEAML